jgi:hypothetical protein
MKKSSAAYKKYLQSKVGLNNGDANDMEAVDTDVKWPYGDPKKLAPNNDVDPDKDWSDKDLADKKKRKKEEEEEDDEDLDEWHAFTDEDEIIVEDSVSESMTKVKVIRDKKVVLKWKTDREGFRTVKEGNHVKEVKMKPEEIRNRVVAQKKAAMKRKAKAKTSEKKREMSIDKRTWDKPKDKI